MDDKLQKYGWACSIVREHVDKCSFGTITIAMANGKVSGIKEEINRKPLLDVEAKA